jgi:integrase/recombinase XerD
MNKKRRNRKLPVILEREELEKMISLPNTRYLTSLRDKAIMKLMANLGLRVSEVVNLRPGDLNLTKRKLRVVNGKGGVDREIPFKTYDNLAAILREWKKRKPQSNYFFSNVRNNGKGKFKSNRGDQLAVRTVQSMISNYAKGPG